MDMQNVLDKLKQIENPTADQEAAIKSTESMTKGGYTPVAETTNTSATYTEYAPESTPGDIAKLAGVQTLAVVGEPLTEGQSPAQKAAFQKMLDAKKGKDNKKEDEVEEDCDASCDDKEKEEVKEAGTVDAIVKGSPNLPKGTNKGYNVEGVEEAVDDDNDFSSDDYDDSRSDYESDVPTIDNPPTGDDAEDKMDLANMNRMLKGRETHKAKRPGKHKAERDRHGNFMRKADVPQGMKTDMRTIEYRTAHYLNDLKDKPDHEEQVQKFAKKFAERNPNFLLNKFLQHAGSKSAKATYVPQGQEYVPGVGLRPIEEDENLAEGPTRKDFQMVADLLKDNPNMDDRKAKAQDYCDKFKAMNPRFNSEKFMKACGVQEAYEFFDKPMDKPVGKSIEEAYDPEHVADIIKKHEDEGHKVELEPFKDEEAGFTVTFKDGKRRHYKYTETGSKVTSLEPDDTYVDPNAPKRGRGRPTKEAVEEPVDEITRMFEAHFEKQLPKKTKKAKKVNESVQVTQSISDEGQESINVNAQGNHVDMLKQMMQLAGQSKGYEEYQGQEVPVEEERDPEHANTPEEKYADVPTQLKHQSGGVNGPKHTSSLKADSEDLHNKADLLGIQNKEDLGLEESLQDLYKEYKG